MEYNLVIVLTYFQNIILRIIFTRLRSNFFYFFFFAKQERNINKELFSLILFPNLPYKILGIVCQMYQIVNSINYL